LGTRTGLLAAAVAATLLAACGGSGTSSNQPATAVQDAASRNIQVTYHNQSDCPVQLNLAESQISDSRTSWASGAPQGQFDAGATAQGTGYGEANYYEADFYFQGPGESDDNQLSFVNPNTGDPGFIVFPGSRFPAGPDVGNPMKEGQTLQNNFKMFCLAKGKIPASSTPVVNASVTRGDDTSSFKVFVVTITN
jgi:hypothetical protein